MKVSKSRRIMEILIFAMITAGLIFYYGIYGYVICASFSIGYIVRIWTERTRCAYCLRIFNELKDGVTIRHEDMSKELKKIAEMNSSIRLIIDNDKKDKGETK